MTTTITRSPFVRTTECADVCKTAKLPRSSSGYNQIFGAHVEVGSGGGRYIATPMHGEQFRVRWYATATAAPAILGIVDGPARVAGLILDHQEGLLP